MTQVKAFTLIEILLSVGLIMLVTGAGVISFSATTRRERLRGAAERVRQAMLQAKANAQSGVKDCGLCGAAGGVCGQGDASLQGWRVTFVQNSSPTPDAFVVEGMCSNSPYPAGPPPVVFYSRSENLPGDVELTTSNGLSSVLFRPGGGGIYPIPTMGPGSIRTITFSYGEDSRTITMDSSGEVQ